MRGLTRHSSQPGTSSRPVESCIREKRPVLSLRFSLRVIDLRHPRALGGGLENPGTIDVMALFVLPEKLSPDRVALQDPKVSPVGAGRPSADHKRKCTECPRGREQFFTLQVSGLLLPARKRSQLNGGHLPEQSDKGDKTREADKESRQERCSPAPVLLPPEQAVSGSLHTNLIRLPCRVVALGIKPPRDVCLILVS